MRVKILLAVCAALSVAVAQEPPSPRANVSGGPLRTDQACYDVRHYALRVAVDPAARAIQGTLTMRADAVVDAASFALDLDDHLAVSRVRYGDDEDVAYAFEGGRIVITPTSGLVAGEAFEVEVAYGGQPVVAARPPWTGGFTWSQTPAGAPWISTTCQGEGADLWWPCKDHPSDKPDGFDLYCTVPEGLVCASNGTLQGAPVTAGGRATYHWRSASPIANYNVALNIAPYVELKETFRCVDGTEMPVSFFVLPSSVRKAKRCLPTFLDHLAVFERLLGPYPFRHEKYGVAESPHLGMEHQTIIAYGNGFRDEQYDWLHNHELAHEWWGNLVTCRDWKDMWLHEGFGTYMQPLYREVRFGRQAYEDEIHRHRAMNRAPIAPREVRDSKQIYFGGGGGNDIYYKGSLVLHTLRYHLGDEPFFEVLRRFAYPDAAAAARTDGGQVRFVDTDDLVALVDEVAGAATGWFFEVYVRSAGLPRIEYEVRDGVLELEWKTPGDAPFSLDVPVSVGGIELRVPMPGGKGSKAVGTADFHIDPGRRVLMARPRRRG